jgi:hypothetical protein
VSRKSKPAEVEPKIGRPSEYSEELADLICDAIAGGKSLIDICASEAMPSARAVYRWLADDSRVDFRHRYACAREAQADKLAGEILQISDYGINDTQVDGDGRVIVDHDVIARSRLRVDSRKWLASKLAPKKYGDKLALGGADDLPPLRVVTRIELVDLVDDSEDSPTA